MLEFSINFIIVIIIVAIIIIAVDFTDWLHEEYDKLEDGEDNEKRN